MFPRNLKLTLSAASAIMLMLPALAVGGSPAWDDAKALASREDKPILIDFYTDW